VADTPVSTKKILVAVMMIVWLVLLLSFLQQRYDAADERKAMALLVSKPPGATWSVGEELAQRANAPVPDCDKPRMISSFQGTLEVLCRAGDPQPYPFHVDLVRKTVTAGDSRSAALIEAAKAKASLESSLLDAGTPSDAGTTTPSP
jgi:hypothetical protein